MSDSVLVYSKFPKKDSHYSSFDVVQYNKIFFVGFDLFKNFNNYLAGASNLSVIRFDHIFDAEKYFITIAF